MISLAALTLLPCSPLQVIESAYEAGYEGVALRLLPGMQSDPDVMADAELRRGIARRIATTGLRVIDFEVLRVSPNTDATLAEAALSFAADLGARNLLITPPDRFDNPHEDELRTAQRIAELCELAGRVRIRPMLEFMVYRAVRGLDEALRMVSLVGHPNFGICVDALHLARSGGSPDAVRHINPQLIASAQLCDAPLESPAPEALPLEARFDRLYPGEGGLPLLDLIRALPADVPISLEAPCRARAAQSATDRARALRESAIRVIAEARAAKQDPRGARP